jgi:hypothetical protein
MICSGISWNAKLETPLDHANPESPADTAR